MNTSQSVVLDERTVPCASERRRRALPLVACMIVLVASHVPSTDCAFAQSPPGAQPQPAVPPDEREAKPLVQIEIKDDSGNDFLMRATELKRSDRTSTIKVVCKKRIGSVGSSMFVMRAFYDIAKARKCEYFVNLKEWTDENGDWVYIGGFTNKKEADLKKEFGEQFDYNNESGQKRKLLSVSQFALVFESLPTKNETAPACPGDGKSPSVSEAAEPEQGPIEKATVYKLRTNSDLFKDVKEGVRIVQGKNFGTAEEAARAYLSSESGATVPARGDLSILTVGPVLDSPDKVLAGEYSRSGKTLTLKITHTNVRKQGLQLRRNFIWRPLVAVPYSPKMSDQEVTVTWTALESLPDGKPLKTEAVVVTCPTRLGEPQKRTDD